MATPDLLFVSDGDPETWNSWSGCSYSILTSLRALGLRVRTGDVGIRGASRLAAIGAAFALPRSRWSQRFENGAVSFAFRSRNAKRLREPGVPVLQAGANFRAPATSLYVVCDANAVFASRGGRYSPIAWLRDREIRALIEREREVYLRCRRIFCFTEGVRQTFIEDFGVQADRVVKTFQGANLPITPGDEVLAAERAGPPSILFVGRMFERKGGPTLVRAFQEVRRAMPHARLHIVGCRPEIEGNRTGIEIHGPMPRERLGALYLSAHIYCQPSHYEPFGTAFVEAMLYGLPCIASREYGGEIVDHNNTGWLVTAGDSDGLASILISVLRRPDELRRAGEAARRHALKSFRWDRTAAIIANGIDGLKPGRAPHTETVGSNSILAER